MTFVNGKDEPSKEPTTKASEPAETFSNTSSTHEWGYDLYPERRSREKMRDKRSLVDVALGKGGREELRKLDCERNVYRCIKRSPLVRLMVGALKASGCPIDIRRHISCEECSPKVTGGYDPILNQVVVCHNNAHKEGIVQGVLTHEMIHMFDYCRNNLDFKNIDHLACTEIRAANLSHCSFTSAWLNGDTSIFNFKESHQYCVKNKALQSVLAVRDVTEEQAMQSINKVFTRCYNDLEPIGRRLKRKSLDIEKAFEDGFYYGYDDGLP